MAGPGNVACDRGENFAVEGDGARRHLSAHKSPHFIPKTKHFAQMLQRARPRITDIEAAMGGELAACPFPILVAFCFAPGPKFIPHLMKIFIV